MFICTCTFSSVPFFFSFITKTIDSLTSESHPIRLAGCMNVSACVSVNPFIFDHAVILSAQAEFLDLAHIS